MLPSWDRFGERVERLGSPWAYSTGPGVGAAVTARSGSAPPPASAVVGIEIAPSTATAPIRHRFVMAWS